MKDTRLTLASAEALLPPGDRILTLRNGAGDLIEDYWERSAVLSQMEKHECHEAGPFFESLGIRFSIWDGREMMFIAFRGEDQREV
jgi:hypothetical protein